MGLEVATYISGLVGSNPIGGIDSKSQGDDHLRLIKNVLQATFPNASRAFRFPTVAATKTANYTVLATDENALLPVDSSGAIRTVTLPLLGVVFPGWCVIVIKVDASANPVNIVGTAGELINGASSFVLDAFYDSAVFCASSIVWFVTNTTRSQTKTGVIEAYGGTTAPAGYLLCDGSAVSRTTYANLFAIIGTAYGAGDLSTTFNVPDLRGRVPLGKDNMGGVSANRVTDTQADNLGQGAGQENHGHSNGSLAVQSHQHGPGTLQVASHLHGSPGPHAVTTFSVAAGVPNTIVPFLDVNAAQHGSTGPASPLVDTGLTGVSAPGLTGSLASADGLPPYQTMNYIIKI